MKADFFIIIVLFSLIISSCDFLEDFEKGNGQIITSERTVDEFTKVRVGGHFDVLLTPADKQEVRVITDENLMPYISAEVRNNTLIVQQEKKLISKEKIRIIIPYKKLTELRLTGTAYIHNEGIMEQDKFDIRMDGAGMIELNLEVNFLEVLLSGAGVVKLSGEVQTQELELTGAGSLRAFDLKSEVCSVTVSGLGGAKINVTRELNARIEGLGGIEYTGNPSDVRTEVNGIGKIEESEKY